MLGPKIPEVNEYHKILATEVQRCVAGELSPEEACEAIREQTDEANGYF